jgi:alcohol dehydrogenase class IV
MAKIYNFQLPKKIIFGLNSHRRVRSEVRSLGAKTVLLVTDPNLMKTGIPRKVEEVIIKENINVDIFADVKAEPQLEVAEAVAKAARKKKYDVVIGVGGGSVIDMAKVASMAVTNPGSMRRYLGVGMVEKPGIPKVLLPTTSGTGSEVTNVAVVTIAEEKMKTAIISPYILGDVAIVDPSFTYTLPQHLTASTGLDALSHALEAIMSIDANPITDSLALQAIKLIFTYLSKAYSIGDAESRCGMSLSSLIAGMAFGNTGVCLGHAVAYTFSVSYKVTHGISCGLALPYIFKFNASAIDWKIPQIAEAMDLETEGVKTKELISNISEAIFSLMDKVKAPKRLRDLGIPREATSKMANKLVTIRRLIQRNPRPLTKKDALKIIEGMW